jgi:cytochrome b561/polyisoprenoid-binding protein YceI
MTQIRYSKAAMALHWVLAVLLAFQFGLGEAFEHMPRGKALFDVAQFHKSIGIAILLLTLARLAVRFVKPRPAPFPDHGWAQWMAKAVHWGFYAMLIIAPLTGWLAVSTAKFDIPTVLFNAIPWPDFPFTSGLEASVEHGWHEWAEAVHGIVAKLGLLLFLLHIVGALRHQFLLKEATIERMLPLRPLSPFVGSALILALAGGAFGLLALGKTPGIAPAADAALTRGDAPAKAAADAPDVANRAVTEEPKADEEAAKAELDSKAKDEAKAAEALKAEEAKAETAKTDANAIPAGEAPRWSVARGGRLNFTTTWSGTPIEGNFGNWDADIRFSPEALAKSSIRVTINLASANSGDGERDSTLKGPDFFNTAAQAQAVWTSSAISHEGGNRYRAKGMLTLRGVARPVPLTFTLSIDGKEARVTGSASLRRLAFGVGQSDYPTTAEIPDPVAIRFNFRANRP